MNDDLVGFGVALLVINVPAKRFEEWVDELAPRLSFVVVTGFVSVAMLVEAPDWPAPQKLIQTL